MTTADPDYPPLTGRLYSLTLARTVLRNLARSGSGPAAAEALARFEAEHGYGLDTATEALSDSDKVRLVEWLAQAMGLSRD